jgi:hypothetical protein
MRVHPAVESLPGRCVSCHRKFWTPRLDEVPPDAEEVRLADHPEWQRAPGERTRPVSPPPEAKPAARQADPPAAPQPAKPPVPPAERVREQAGSRDPLIRSEVSDRTRSDAALPAVPLDILEPLRRVASCVELVEMRMREPEEGRTGPDQATLESYRRILASIRERHEQRLKSALFDATERLVALLEGTALATLKFRTGELSYDQFYTTVWESRARREALERHRQNLRGWLACRDTLSLGGPVAVTLDDIDLESSDLNLSAPVPVSDPLIPHHVGRLGDALEAQDRAARRLRECRRMGDDSGLSGAALAAAEQSAAADMARVRAEVAFRRARLGEMLRDFDADRAAIEARLQLPAEKTDEDAARELRRSLDDMRRLRGWIQAALDAKSTADLPMAQPTLFRRLDSRKAVTEVAVEALPAYAAAVLLLVLSLPLFSTTAGGGAYAPSGTAALAALVMAFASAVVPVLRNRMVRGAVLAGLLAAQGLVWGADLGMASGGAPAFSGWVLAALLSFASGAAALAAVWWPERPRELILTVAVSAVVCAGAFTAGGMAPAHTAGPAPVASTVAETLPSPAPESPAPPAPRPPEVPATDPAPVTAPVPPAAPPQETGEVPEPVAGVVPAPEEPPLTAPPAAPAPVAEMTLRGVFHKEGDPPRFRITLLLPSGRIREIDGVLGDNIHAGWKAAEYSSSMQKLTLSRSGKMLVVKPGETVELPEDGAG